MIPPCCWKPRHSWAKPCAGSTLRRWTRKTCCKPGAGRQAMCLVGILAVQGDFEAHSRTLDRMRESWRLVKKPSDFEGLSGLILPGGESTSFLKHLEEESLAEPIRRFAESHPVFGTCAGAILMADKVE